MELNNKQVITIGYYEPANQNMNTRTTETVDRCKSYNEQIKTAAKIPLGY